MCFDKGEIMVKYEELGLFQYMFEKAWLAERKDEIIVRGFIDQFIENVRHGQTIQEVFKEFNIPIRFEKDLQFILTH